jgi:hypothetical protein
MFNMTARTNAARGMGMLRGRRSSAATSFAWLPHLVAR